MPEDDLVETGAVLWVAPANIAFDGKGAILLTNHAFVTGVTNPEQFSILNVFVADTSSPLEMPFIS